MLRKNFFVLMGVLLLSACSAHRQCCQCRYYCPTLLTIQMVEKRWGTPNEVISQQGYTWYGYVTKLQTDYPVKKNFSDMAPRTPIAIPVPVAHSKPQDSFARYGCSVWYKAEKHGVVVEARREGKFCGEGDFVGVVGS